MKLARLDDGPEIFHTIQGEGVSAGLPAVFVRAALCNLHCQWCDTEYTWNFEGTPWKHDKDADAGGAKHDKSRVILDMEVADVADLVLRHPARRVVLTGGEPLLQQDDWCALIERLRRADPAYVFEVETNGSLVPGEAFAAAVDQFNVSPKLANSGMAESLRLVPRALEFFRDDPRAWFKFVARGEADFAEIEALRDRFDLPAGRLLVMPEGRRGADLDRHAGEVAAACLRRGWRFADRLHVRLWGDRRGV